MHSVRCDCSSLSILVLKPALRIGFVGKTLFFYYNISFIQLFFFDDYTLSQIPQVLQEQDCISPGK